jgi:hypothetical protein
VRTGAVSVPVPVAIRPENFQKTSKLINVCLRDGLFAVGVHDCTDAARPALTAGVTSRPPRAPNMPAPTPAIAACLVLLLSWSACNGALVTQG